MACGLQTKQPVPFSFKCAMHVFVWLLHTEVLRLASPVLQEVLDNTILLYLL